MTHGDGQVVQQDDDAAALMQKYINEEYIEPTEAPDDGHNYGGTTEASDGGPKLGEYPYSEFYPYINNPGDHTAARKEDDSLTKYDLEQLARQIYNSKVIDEATCKTKTGDDDLAGGEATSTAEPVPEVTSAAERVSEATSAAERVPMPTPTPEPLTPQLAGEATSIAEPVTTATPNTDVIARV